jgi:hypothetical protein
MNSPNIAGTRCQMYCTDPIGPHGDPGTEDTKAMCPSCMVKLSWLCGEVLPAIRRQGYWTPTGATAEQELAAIIGQAGLRETQHELITSLLGPGALDVLDGDAS